MYDPDSRYSTANTNSSTANSRPWYKPDRTKNYPPNNGAVPGSEELINLPEGTIIVRYGKILTIVYLLQPQVIV